MIPSRLLLRTARASDAPAIARVMRAALMSHDWMPMVHTPDEYLAFISAKVLPEQKVTIADWEGLLLGFVAIRDDWVEQVYREQFQQKCAAVLRSELRENKEIEHFRDSKKNGNVLYAQWTGLGIGTALLKSATGTLPVTKLFCFQANGGARRFYERHGFRPEAFGDGSGDEEGLPDILYVRRT